MGPIHVDSGLSEVGKVCFPVPMVRASVLPCKQPTIKYCSHITPKKLKKKISLLLLLAVHNKIPCTSSYFLTVIPTHVLRSSYSPNLLQVSRTNLRPLFVVSTLFVHAAAASIIGNPLLIQIYSSDNSIKWHL